VYFFDALNYNVHDLFVALIADVKAQLKSASAKLRNDLSSRFPPVETLEALSIVYPQYLADDEKCTDVDFKRRLDVVVRCFTGTKFVDATDYGIVGGKVGKTAITSPLCAELLVSQSSKFKSYARNHAKAIMEQESGNIPKLTLFWRIFSKIHGAPRVSEWLKLARLAMCMVGGSVEDERAFSALAFVKNKQRNALNVHLELCVCLKTQHFFQLEDFYFPYIRSRYSTLGGSEEAIWWRGSQAEESQGVIRFRGGPRLLHLLL
jgi:hypothetical protein